MNIMMYYFVLWLLTLSASGVCEGRAWCRPCACDNTQAGGVRLLCAGKGLHDFPALTPAIASRVTLVALQRNRISELDGAAMLLRYPLLARLDVADQLSASCVRIKPPLPSRIVVHGKCHFSQ